MIGAGRDCAGNQGSRFRQSLRTGHPRRAYWGQLVQTSSPHYPNLVRTPGDRDRVPAEDRRPHRRPRRRRRPRPQRLWRGPDDKSTTADGKSAATATSAADFGGLDALVKAAKKEGTLHAIALPRDWANYGALIDGFKKKYGIKIEVENPDGSSQDEINAVTSRKGQDRAPDVLDLGSSFALSAAQQGLLAPYKVTAFADIPEGRRTRRAAGSTTTAATSPSAATPRRSRSARRPSRTCSSRSTRARSPSTATPPSPVRPSVVSTRPRWPTAVRSTTSSPAWTSSPS